MERNASCDDFFNKQYTPVNVSWDNGSKQKEKKNGEENSYGAMTAMSAEE
jgi:hypothetical protein